MPLRSAMSLCATRIPRPPPPADALTITGYPMSRAIFTASSSSVIFPLEPGNVGTLFRSVRHAHPPSATPRRRLDDHRVPDVPGDLHRLLLVGDLPLGARERRHLVPICAPRASPVRHPPPTP